MTLKGRFVLKCPSICRCIKSFVFCCNFFANKGVFSIWGKNCKMMHFAKRVKLAKSQHIHWKCPLEFDLFETTWRTLSFVKLLKSSLFQTIKWNIILAFPKYFLLLIWVGQAFQKLLSNKEKQRNNKKDKALIN